MLMENFLYSYYTMATNRIGDSESTSININKLVLKLMSAGPVYDASDVTRMKTHLRALLPLM